jgi:hypothetical protein
MSSKFKFQKNSQGTVAVTRDAVISSNYRLFPYAEQMCDIAVKLATPNKTKYLVLGHGMGCMTMSLYGTILHHHPYLCNNISIDSIEANPFMLKRAIDSSKYTNINIFKQDANVFVKEACKHTKYDAILYDLFGNTLDIVWIDVEPLFSLSDVLIMNIINQSDIAKLLNLAHVFGIDAVKINVETFGPYYSDLVPNMEFSSSNKVITLVKNVDLVEFCSSFRRDFRQRNGCLLDMKNRVIYTSERPFKFEHFGTLHGIPLAKIGGENVKY